MSTRTHWSDTKRCSVTVVTAIENARELVPDDDDAIVASDLPFLLFEHDDEQFVVSGPHLLDLLNFANEIRSAVQSQARAAHVVSPTATRPPGWKPSR